MEQTTMSSVITMSTKQRAHISHIILHFRYLKGHCREKAHMRS